MSDPSVVKVPTQARSRRSLERLLAAGLETLEEEGWDGFTIQAVADRAEVAAGTIYTRFANKQALLIALYDRFAEGVADQGRPSRRRFDPEQLQLDALVRDLVENLVATFRAHGKLMRVFATRATVDEDLAVRVRRQMHQLAREFTDALLCHRQGFARPNPRLAADMAYRLVFDVLAQRMLFGSRFESELDIEWDELCDELVAAVLAYLSGPASRPPVSRRASNTP